MFPDQPVFISPSAFNEFDRWTLSDSGFNVGLTVILWPEASLWEHPAGCVRRTGRWDWGWGWAAWPRSGCSSGPWPGWAGGRPSGPCSWEPAAPPRQKCSAPSSWRPAAKAQTGRKSQAWSTENTSYCNSVSSCLSVSSRPKNECFCGRREPGEKLSLKRISNSTILAILATISPNFLPFYAAHSYNEQYLHFATHCSYTAYTWTLPRGF